MDKKEFLEKVKALREQKRQFESEYIDSNMQFPVGTKVKITREDGKLLFGIVKFYVVEYDEVTPYVTLIMKDGEESQRRIHIRPEDKVEAE